MYTLNCKGKLLNLEFPVVMGILNITANSFYKGFLSESTEQITQRAGKMLADGASILDIGGQSTRPGSEPVTADEEMERVLPVIESILLQFPQAIISVDTYYASVAKEAVGAGAIIVNDISAGNLDNDMIATVGKLGVPYICMHMKGTPATMQLHTDYDNILQEMFAYFAQKTALCKVGGITDVVLDPGFGFAKTIEQNFYLLKNLQSFTNLGYPLMAGLSRKATIYKTLKSSAGEALNGTTVLNTIALQNGANILRVHDVKEAVEAIKLLTALSMKVE